MELETKRVVAVIGGGSWATAIAKILHDNRNEVHWFIRNEETRMHLKQNGNNPSYLSDVQFNLEQIHVEDDINAAIARAEVVFVVVRSAYLPAWLEGVEGDSFKGRLVITAVKGIIPELHMTATEYIHHKFAVS